MYIYVYMRSYSVYMYIHIYVCICIYMYTYISIRPRMEKAQSGRSRTGRLPDFHYRYGNERLANVTLLTLQVQIL